MVHVSYKNGNESNSNYKNDPLRKYIVVIKKHSYA